MAYRLLARQRLGLTVILSHSNSFLFQSTEWISASWKLAPSLRSCPVNVVSDPRQRSWISFWAGLLGGALGFYVEGSPSVASGEVDLMQHSSPTEDGVEWRESIVKEEMTGCAFPRYLSGTERLVSAGVRLMTPLKIRVYAVGVYMDPVAGKIALKEWYGLPKDELLKQHQLWDIMCAIDSGFDRTIRVVVIREVDGSHMQNGFNRGLTPRVQRARREQGLKGGSAALKLLNKFFLKKKLFQEGCEILFRWSGRGTLDVYIDSKFYGRIENENLCWSLWDLYLGEKSVAPHVKSQVAAALPDFLR